MREDLVYRLRRRAEIRRQIATRKSVQEGKPDRIADLLEEAAAALEELTAGSDFDSWQSSFTDDDWEDVDVRQAFEAGVRFGMLDKPENPE